MAQIRKGILGAVRGTIGSVVGYQRLGKAVIQSKSKVKGAAINSVLTTNTIKVQGLARIWNYLTLTIKSVVWNNSLFRYNAFSMFMSQKMQYINNDGTIDFDNLRLGAGFFDDNLNFTYGTAQGPVLLRQTISNLSSFYPLDGSYTLYWFYMNQDFSRLQGATDVITTDSINDIINKIPYPTGSFIYVSVIVVENATGKSNKGYSGSISR